VDLQNWDVRDPGRLLDEIVERHDLHAGLVVVGLVEDPPRQQQLLGSTVAWDGLSPPDRDECRELIRSAVNRLPIQADWTLPPRHAFTTVVCRSGRAIIGPAEAVWLYGWRYANHLQPVFQGDLLLVTDHGWCSFDDDSGGSTPRLAATAIPR